MARQLINLYLRRHVDYLFTSGMATRTAISGGYVNGIWATRSAFDTNHLVTIQPLNNKQIEFLNIGGERVEDYRQVWVNDGSLAEISPSDIWNLPNLPGDYKTTQLDNRPDRFYCKFIAAIINE